MYPNRSEEDKVILARREKEDLDKKVKFLLKDNDVKAERLVIMHPFITWVIFLRLSLSNKCASVGW